MKRVVGHARRTCLVDHEDTLVYMDGRYIHWSESKIHVSTHAFLYGTAVFEGIRAYWNAKKRQLNIFSLQEHCDRLERNARMMGFDGAPTSDELRHVIITLLQKNGFEQDVYIRPVIYLGEGTVRVRPTAQKVKTLVFAFVLKKYFEKDGLRCMVSSWIRPPSSVLPPMGKVNGAYANSYLASVEAQRAGYDESIMLNQQGLVSEGPAENFMMIRKGTVITPPLSADILDGVTREFIFRLCKDLKIPFVERSVPRVELYTADEMFFCGTGVEIEPIVEIEGRKIGDGTPGKLTRKIRERFHKAVRGDHPGYKDRLTLIPKRKI